MAGLRLGSLPCVSEVRVGEQRDGFLRGVSKVWYDLEALAFATTPDACRGSWSCQRYHEAGIHFRLLIAAIVYHYR